MPRAAEDDDGARRVLGRSPSPSGTAGSPPRVVTLVVAHPDDEAMFFAPTLATLRSHPEASVTVLCLSNGNASGLGPAREKEMLASCCDVFGVRRDRVDVVDDPLLPDGMDTTWNPQVVARHVRRHVATHGSHVLVTFDRHGVTRHPNHCATADGVRALKGQEGHALAVWELASVGVLANYAGWILGILGIYGPWAPWGGLADASFFRPGAALDAFRAMRRHRTQFVWYRVLHVLFSRYVFHNTLRKVGML